MSLLVFTVLLAFSGNNMFPQWSHDGKRIVFTSTRDGDPEIYVMNADGTKPVRLTNTPGRDAHPYFSKDGRRIVFQSPRANGKDTNIYLMNSDGSNVVQLTNLKGLQECRCFRRTKSRSSFNGARVTISTTTRSGGSV